MAFDSYWINEPYTAWRLEGLKLFMEHTLRHHAKDVYFVRLIDILNWVQQPVGLEQMKRGYLADVAIRPSCQVQSEAVVDEVCLNGEEVTSAKFKSATENRTLLMIFDAVSEPLFRSSIVYYSTLTFLILAFVTVIYDRVFTS